jgi:hypothetical protein
MEGLTRPRPYVALSGVLVEVILDVITCSGVQTLPHLIIPARLSFSFPQLEQDDGSHTKLIPAALVATLHPYGSLLSNLICPLNHSDTFTHQHLPQAAGLICFE